MFYYTFPHSTGYALVSLGSLPIPYLLLTYASCDICLILYDSHPSKVKRIRRRRTKDVFDLAEKYPSTVVLSAHHSPPLPSRLPVCLLFPAHLHFLCIIYTLKIFLDFWIITQGRRSAEIPTEIAERYTRYLHKLQPFCAPLWFTFPSFIP